VTIGGTARILVAAGDSAERHRLVDYFGEHCMPAVSAPRRNDVMRQFATAEPTLVILDLQIDSGKGLDLIREIRSRSDVPVIIITDHSCDEIDPVLGLEYGADDCLRRPFGLRELLARVRAILRRLPGPNASRRSPKCGSCTFAGWHLDRRSRRLTSPRGDRVALTKGEYALLLAFLRAPQRPLSRKHLLGATRLCEDIHDRSIDVQIFRLRRKLESDPETPRAVATERGVGYLFALPVQELVGRVPIRTR
jgi:two-component system, OmpR family, response regulator